MINTFVNLFLILVSILLFVSGEECNINEIFIQSQQCLLSERPPSNDIYLMYDINSVEGFNLR